MKEQLLITASSILLPPNPTPNPPNPKPYPLKRSTILPKKSCPPPPSPDPPLLSHVRHHPQLGRRLQYYADLASKLASTGRIDDFVMISESVLAAGTDPSQFLDFVNVELISAGISRFLEHGKLRTVVEALGKVERLGIRPSSLLDGSTKESLVRECRRMVDGGEMEEFVELMESLAGNGADSLLFLISFDHFSDELVVRNFICLFLGTLKLMPTLMCLIV